jgi:type IV secretory pathway VirB2 component (pilin)
MARNWQELSSGQKAAVLTLASVQLSLAATAWTDLARRPADQVNGPKAAWAAVIAINFVGPVLYFTKGRRKAG